MKFSSLSRVFMVTLPLLLGCAHATPVTPVPATAAEVDAMRRDVVGKWQATTVKKQDSAAEPWSGGDLFFTFSREGNLRLELTTSLADLDQQYAYSFEGKNLKTTYPFISDARVDALSQSELKLFNYGNSETISFARR
jgi:hypothetical protein